MPKTIGLTDKQQHFVAEYLVDKNAARAALAAGFSARTARKQGSLLLAKPHIRAAITKALKEQEKRTLISADMVLKRIDRVAQKAEANGDFSAANQANKLLGQHYKLFTEKHEHGGMGGGPVLLQITGAEADH